MRGYKSDRFRHALGLVAASLLVLALGALFASVRAGTATSGRPVSPPVSPPPGPVVNDIQTQPFAALVPCANNGVGEVISGTIELHVLITSRLNGNNVSGFYHYQPAGGNLVGSVTGDTYQATGVTQSSFHGSLQNGLYTTTFINNFRLIGQGPGNNYLVHETAHLTLNANGDVTVNHDLFTIECGPVSPPVG